MKAKGMSSKTPCPIWVEGEYITNPPVRPRDGAIRPAGHYIDKGGYPGANVYEVSKETLCWGVGIVDKLQKNIYERDILLYETPEESTYIVIQSQNSAVDIINGECMDVRELTPEEIKVIGNSVDSADFVQSIRYHMEQKLPIPYVPYINVQQSGMPYMMFHCKKCGVKKLSCKYMGICPACGGYTTVGYATELKRA